MLNSGQKIATPRNASTVIVLEENQPDGFQVLLLKRHGKSAFMAGNFVYPGGVVEEQDHQPEILSSCHGGSAEAGELLPFMIAGIRELFEESGLLLARNEDGVPFRANRQEVSERFVVYRDLLNRRKTTFAEILRQEGLSPAFDQLHHYAHWITPEGRPLRFNTHFFVACHPGGQQASADNGETTEWVWMTPGKALEENLARNLILSPPTLKTLEDMSRCGTAEEVIASSKTCAKSPVLSLFLKISGDNFLIFPWDPEYETLRRGDVPECVKHGRISTPADNTTRILTTEQYNIPYCKEI